jgi:hypothetical protein
MSILAQVVMQSATRRGKISGTGIRKGKRRCGGTRFLDEEENPGNPSRVHRGTGFPGPLRQVPRRTRDYIGQALRPATEAPQCTSSETRHPSSYKKVLRARRACISVASGSGRGGIETRPHSRFMMTPRRVDPHPLWQSRVLQGINMASGVSKLWVGRPVAAAIFPKQVVEFMKTRSGRLDVSLDESFSGSGSGRRPCRSF